MPDNEAIVRHGLANLMTTLTILIANSHLKPDEKQKMEDAIRRACMLVAYESILLDKPFACPKEPVDVGEVVQMLLDVFGQRWKKIHWRMPSAPALVSANRNALSDALELILKHLSDAAPSSTIEISERQLTIGFSDARQTRLKRGDLLKLLQKGINEPEWGFELGLRLLELNGFKTTLEKGEIMIEYRGSKPKRHKL